MNQEQKPQLILLPGMGADGRLFKHLDTCGLDASVIDYPLPRNEEGVHEYAARLTKKVPKARPVILVGVSMGGVLAQEMSCLLSNCVGVVLISTVKNPSEIPGWLLFLKKAGLGRLLSPWLIRHSLIIIRWFIGSGSKESYQVFREMLFDTPPDIIRWGMRRIPEWPGVKLPVLNFHIHGDRDHLFPVSKVESPLVIKGGKHFMVFNHADHVNPVFRGCVERIIRQIQ